MGTGTKTGLAAENQQSEPDRPNAPDSSSEQQW